MGGKGRSAGFSRGLALAVGLAAARPVSAHGAEAGPPTSTTVAPAALAADGLPSVRVDVDIKLKLEDVQEELGELARAAVSEQLRAGGFAVANPSAYAIRVVIRHFDRDEGLGYRATIEFPMPAGQVSLVESAGCACAAATFIAELSTAVAGKMPAYVEAHRSALKAKAAPPSPTVSPAGPATPAQRPRYKMEFLGGIGVGLLVLGVGGITGGAVMWKLGSDRGEPRSRSGLGRGGVTFVGAGLLMLLAGAGLLATDVVIDRKWRRPLRAAAQVGPRGVSLGLSGRL